MLADPNHLALNLDDIVRVSPALAAFAAARGCCPALADNCSLAQIRPYVERGSNV
jgi:hypothetical protein